MALERAAELTAEPEARAGRLGAAGQSAWQAGQLVRAAGLLEEARLLTADPIVSADVDQLRAWIELSIGSGMTARRLLIDAAKEIADIEPDRALEMLAAAAEAAWVDGDAQAGNRVGPGRRAVASGRHAADPVPDPPRQRLRRPPQRRRGPPGACAP